MDAPVTVWVGDVESTVTWQAVFTGVSSWEVQVWGVTTMSSWFTAANYAMGMGTAWASHWLTLRLLAFPWVPLENGE